VLSKVLKKLLVLYSTKFYLTAVDLRDVFFDAARRAVRFGDDVGRPMLCKYLNMVMVIGSNPV